MILEFIDSVIKISLVNNSNDMSDSVSKYRKKCHNNQYDDNASPLIRWVIVSISNRTNCNHNKIKSIKEKKLLFTRKVLTKFLSKNDQSSANKERHEKPKYSSQKLSLEIRELKVLKCVLVFELNFFLKFLLLPFFIFIN